MAGILKILAAKVPKEILPGIQNVTVRRKLRARLRVRAALIENFNRQAELPDFDARESLCKNCDFNTPIFLPSTRYAFINMPIEAFQALKHFVLLF